MQGVVFIDGAPHAIAVARRANKFYVTANGLEIRFPAQNAVQLGNEIHDIETIRSGDRIWVHYNGETHELIWRTAVDHLAADSAGAGGHVVRAPMPGAIVSVLVTLGQRVELDDAVIVIESMKLENTLRAPMSGAIAEIAFAPGESFERDAVLITLVEAG